MSDHKQALAAFKAAEENLKRAAYAAARQAADDARQSLPEGWTIGFTCRWGGDAEVRLTPPRSRPYGAEVAASLRSLCRAFFAAAAAGGAVAAVAALEAVEAAPTDDPVVTIEAALDASEDAASAHDAEIGRWPSCQSFDVTRGSDGRLESVHWTSCLGSTTSLTMDTAGLPHDLQVVAPVDRTIPAYRLAAAVAAID